MAVILHSIYGSRVGLSADGVLVIDGSAATYGANFGNGSAGSPSVSFTSDTDTGVYHKGANNLGFAVNGALGMDLSTTALTLATGTDLVFSGTTGQCLIQFTDNLASALVIGEGANAYITFVSTDASEAVSVSKVLKLAAGLTYTGSTGVNLVSIPDNLASALDITEGANTYLKFVTTNSSEAINLGVSLTIADAKNIVLNTTTGTKIGTGTTQKLGFFNATPVVQQTAATTTTGFTASTGTTVVSGSTFTGNSGSTAYTIGDIVLALKTLGLIAA